MIKSEDGIKHRNDFFRSVVRFFITNITQPDTISQDTIISYTTNNFFLLILIKNVFDKHTQPI